MPLIHPLQVPAGAGSEVANRCVGETLKLQYLRALALILPSN
jgi:hypothetical protein